MSHDPHGKRGMKIRLVAGLFIISLLPPLRMFETEFSNLTKRSNYFPQKHQKLFDNHVLEYHFRDQVQYHDCKSASDVDEPVVIGYELVVIAIVSRDFVENSQKYLVELIFRG